MKEGFIYGLANASDGIIKYIGLTTSTLSHRLAQHKVEKRINKRTSWIKSIISSGNSVSIIEIDRVPVSELSAAEQNYIKLFLASGSPLKNMTSGGEMTIHSPETRKKISDKHKGKKLSPSHYKNVCIANRLKGISKRKPCYHERMANKKTRGEYYKKLYQFDLNGNLIKEWESITKCCKELNYCKGNIIKCCKKKKESVSSYGFMWSYYSTGVNPYNETVLPKKKQVLMFDMNGDLINSFESVEECAKSLNMLTQNVSKKIQSKKPRQYILRYGKDERVCK